MWLAELAYRCALHRQTDAWAERGQRLETFLGQAHDAERQRRLKLRHVLMELVLQKHATAFQRIQQLHTEALESYFEHTLGVDTNVTADKGDEGEQPNLVSTKQDLPKKNKTNQHRAPATYTTRERIERMARAARTTPVWDEEPPLPLEVNGGKSAAVDVDTADPRDLEESELPLLKHATRASTVEYQKKKKRDKFAKIKSGVILDMASNKNAMFLDRILYSGSLLESHYIHLAVVAGIEEDAISPVIDDSLRKAELKPLLVVITSDRTVHMFEIPRPSEDEDPAIQELERAITPGSSPDAALGYLLDRQAMRNVKENKAKEKALLIEEEAAQQQLQLQQQQRPKFIRVRTKTVTEPTTVPAAPSRPMFHFYNMRPSVTFALADYIIRENNTNSSIHSIKITIKDRDRYDPVQGKSFSKLNFDSTTDLQAFLLAAELTKGELTSI